MTYYFGNSNALFPEPPADCAGSFRAELEIVHGQFHQVGLGAGEEVPVGLIAAVGRGEGLEDFGRVMGGVGGQRHIVELGRELGAELAHLLGEHRAKSWAAGENDVGQPRFAEKMGVGDDRVVLVGKLEGFNAADDGQPIGVALEHRLLAGGVLILVASAPDENVGRDEGD